MPVNPPPASTAALPDWLDWLMTLSPREMELGLDRISTVLARLDLPRPRRVIHIAGTNGKGSSAAMLEALYLADGERVGCYTSPHVLRFNERMRVAGEPLDDARILSALRSVEAVRGDIPLTFFEYTTAAALVAFANAGTSVLVLEIGLGGRLDAVNAVDPDAALITNIGFDHCDWLGCDLDSIAREKAGVMRQGRPVIFAAATMPAAIEQVAADRRARLYRAGRDFSYNVSGHRWTWRFGEASLADLKPPALRGRFQYDNAAGALATYVCLEGVAKLTAAEVNRAWSELCLPGRLQSFGERWLLDVAHNPLAATELALELQRQFPDGGITAVIGALKDKDSAGLLQPLLPVVANWVSVTPHSARSLAARSLAAQIATAANKPCYIASDIDDALAIAERIAEPQHGLLVTGSFFVVGPALASLQARPE